MIPCPDRPYAHIPLFPRTRPILQPPLPLLLRPPRPLQPPQLLSDLPPLISLYLLPRQLRLIPCHPTPNVAANQRRMNPALRHEDGADGELGSRMQVRLPDCVDDARKRVRSGLQLGEGDFVHCSFGGEHVDGTGWIGIRWEGGGGGQLCVLVPTARPGGLKGPNSQCIPASLFTPT